MQELALIAPLGGIVVLCFLYQRRLGSPAADHWAWAWLLLYVGGLCSAFESRQLALGVLADAAGTGFAPLVLAGALAYTGRRPRGLLAATALVAGVRAATTLGLGREVSQWAAIALKVPWLAAAGGVLVWHARRPGSSSPERLLGPACLALAVVAGADCALRALHRDVGYVLAAWMLVSLALAMLQILSLLEQTRERERTLLAEREQLARVVELTSDLVSIADCEGRVQYVNAAGRRLLELPEGFDVRRLRVGVGHGLEDRRRLFEERLPAAARDDVWQGEVEIQTDSGRRLPVSQVLIAQRDENGKVTHFANVMRDLADRVGQERALATEQRRLRAVLETAPIGILLIDFDRRIVLANAAASQRLGLGEPEPWLGRDAVEAFESLLGHVRDRDALVTALARLGGLDPREAPVAVARRMLSHPDVVIEDLALEITAPEARSLRLFSSPVRSERGEPIGRVWAVRDVTEERRLEAQLLRSQKLEAVGRLASGIAHDFNNLLMAIGGYADLLAHRCAADEESSEAAVEIRELVDRAAELTRQLLVFSSRPLLQPTVVQLNRVIERVTPMLRRLLGEDVEIAVTLDPRAGSVRADAAQLEQVIVNLAVNARDAMPEGGRLLIETHGCEESAPEQRRVRLRVVDSGVGMDDATQGRIFEPFFTTKAPGRGTGLGLSTVFGIVSQCGGEIRVESAPGKGTTFEIDLPDVEGQPAPSPPEPPAANALPRGSGTVLVVEDEPAVARVVRRVLADQGFDVLAAANGTDAVSLAASFLGPIDVLLTDVVLPGMSGIELAETLAQRRPRMKVLYMSGYAEHPGVRGRIGEDEMALLRKPFRASELVERVAALLEVRRTAPFV